MDRVSLHPAIRLRMTDKSTEYASLGAPARHGLAILGDAPATRRVRLLETAAFADFLLERMPALAAELERMSGMPDLDTLLHPDRRHPVGVHRHARHAQGRLTAHVAREEP
ncbi:hypothetical protein [Streptosporangium sandarakinum]|uniref:hypothetical protein n=1 Tax=Streptosporangium sandarakinum TaxID=1260955 RepID=UPI0033AC53B2